MASRNSSRWVFGYPGEAQAGEKGGQRDTGRDYQPGAKAGCCQQGDKAAQCQSEHNQIAVPGQCLDASSNAIILTSGRYWQATQLKDLPGQGMHGFVVDAVLYQFVDQGKGMRLVRQQEIQSPVHGLSYRIGLKNKGLHFYIFLFPFYVYSPFRLRDNLSGRDARCAGLVRHSC